MQITKKKYTNNFDAVARFYDFFSKLIYGNAQVKAQEDLLHFIPPNSRVLIVGGGPGTILQSLEKLAPHGLSIVYVELSERMIAISQKRNCTKNKIQFIQKDIIEYKTNQRFDIIITSFLFDNFTEIQAKSNFNHLNEMLSPKGFWLSTDFSLEKKNGLWWKNILQKMMYKYFNFFGVVEGNHFIDLDEMFLKNNYVLKAKYFRYRGFMKGTVYQK